MKRIFYFQNILLIIFMIQLLMNSCISESQTIEPLIDPRDNREYECKQIGDQVWMIENLSYKTESGRSVYYAEDSVRNHKLGRLYFSDEIDEATNIHGWHLPDTTEWLQLLAYYQLSDMNFGAGKNHNKYAERDEGFDENILRFLSKKEGFNFQYGGLWHLKWQNPSLELQKCFEYKNKGGYYWAGPIDDKNKYTHFSLGQYKYNWIELTSKKPSLALKSGDRFRFQIRLIKD